MATTIQWTDETWNPVTGCSKVSQGCKNCYAERIWPRVYGGRPFTDVQFHEDRLAAPLKWKSPRRIFVNSMSDMFHEALTFEQIKRVWDVASEAQRHTFQILTKRPGRALAFARWLAGADDISIAEWPCNAWIGVSVEDQKTADERIPILRQIPAAIRWLSCEPLIGPITFRPVCETLNDKLAAMENGYANKPMELVGIDWVVIGGESGPVSKVRPFDIRWAYYIVQQCREAGVPVFVKQLGRKPTFSGGDGQAALVNLNLNDSHGGDMSEWPEDLRIREFPAGARLEGGDRAGKGE